MLALIVAFGIAATGCGGDDIDRDAMAGEIGAEIALRLRPSLAPAGALDVEDSTDILVATIDEILGNLELPEGVYRAEARGYATTRLPGGYTEVWFPIVVVPQDTEAMFCVTFALASTGAFLVEPAAGDPLSFCDDVEPVRLRMP